MSLLAYRHRSTFAADLSFCAQPPANGRMLGKFDMYFRRGLSALDHISWRFDEARDEFRLRAWS